jgi:hypothetical protein
VQGAAVSPPSTDLAFRLRPGERPVWIELPATADAAQRWTSAASNAGVSVDVAVALQLEWSLIHSDVSDSHSISQIVERADAAAAEPRLAPTDALRRWIAYISDGPRPRAEHDLPSVALPARLVARLTPTTIVKDVSACADEMLNPSAVIVERAAALLGMTMDAWAYRELARLCR